MVPEYVAPLDEDAVQTAAFEMLFAFDEVISLGYKEHVTVQQARPLPCWPWSDLQDLAALSLSTYF